MAKHNVTHETYTKLLATVNRGDRIVPPPALFDRYVPPFAPITYSDS